jgi:hypothetical protein
MVSPQNDNDYDSNREIVLLGSLRSPAAGMNAPVGYLRLHFAL